VFDELGARAWTSPARGAVHNLAVDAYSLQHPDEYGKSSKSYAAHLIGLCCGLEFEGDSRLYWAIGRWLDGPAAPPRPAVPDARGTLTIADVRVASTDDEHAARVRSWARNVWQAYAAQHDLARAWLREVADGAAGASRRSGRG
jgi:hypothetical protein